MTTHANGDAGIQDAIDAYAAAMRTYRRPDARHTLQHGAYRIDLFQSCSTGTVRDVGGSP